MILYLIRHGQTASNRDGLGLGRDDVPLTEFGERQATALGGRLAGEPLDHVYTSPLARAVRTAELVTGERAIPIERREQLAELDVGDTEGLSFAQIRERYGDFLKQWQSEACASVRMPGGESLDDVAARVGSLVDEVRSSGDEAVALVSHNFVLRVVLCQLMDIPLVRFRALPLGLASLSTIITNERGRLSVRVLNDSCHLRSLES